MGRFVYQPVPSELASESKHGQVIADIYSGHISTNHHNVLVSATERIEAKLDDVFQIESNIVEQTNVIFNLDEDYNYLIENQYSNTVVDLNKVKLDMNAEKINIDFLKTGILDTEYSDGTVKMCILNQLREAINDMLEVYATSADFQSECIKYDNIFIAGDLAGTASPGGINGDFSFNGQNFTSYVKTVELEIENQRNDINILINNVSKLVK